MLFVEECWFAPWSALEYGVDFVEFSLHGFDPVEFAVVGDFPNAMVQFDLSILSFTQFVGENVIVDADDEFWNNVQRGQDGGIESKCQSTSENGVTSQQNIAALFQQGDAFGQITVSVFNAAEGVDVLFGQFAEVHKVDWDESERWVNLNNSIFSRATSRTYISHECSVECGSSTLDELGSTSRCP